MAPFFVEKQFLVGEFFLFPQDCAIMFSIESTGHRTCGMEPNVWEKEVRNMPVDMKGVIAEAFLKMIQRNGLDKITVKALIEECHISRQTFYYHFQDKYELLVWIYFNELFAPNMEDISLENWDEKLGAILTQMQEEKKFYINTIKHAEDYIIQYMLEVAEQTFEEAIDKLDEKSHLKNEERGIFARFFAYGICGIIVEWAKGGMKMAPEKLADYMREMLEKCKQAVYISDHDRQ